MRATYKIATGEGQGAHVYLLICQLTGSGTGRGGKPHVMKNDAGKRTPFHVVGPLYDEWGGSVTATSCSCCLSRFFNPAKRNFFPSLQLSRQRDHTPLTSGFQVPRCNPWTKELESRMLLRKGERMSCLYPRATGIQSFEYTSKCDCLKTSP